MTRLPSDASLPPELARRFADLGRQIDQLRTARTSEATSIGEGGLRLHSGGTLRVSYPSGNTALLMGDVTGVETGEDQGFGLLIQGDGDEQIDRLDIFRAREHPVIGRQVVIGQTGGPIDVFESYAAETQIRGGDFWLGLTADPVDLQVRASAAVIHSTSDMSVISDGQTSLGGDGGTFIQPESTGNAANVHMAVDGRVFRSTSSRRYKDDIQDLQVDTDAVLSLRPRSWLPGPMPRSCPDWLHEQHADGECPADSPAREPDPAARRQVGFVAEELVEAGLGEFVEFVDGQPEAIFYDRLTAALLPLVQRQQQQILDLAARVEALENRA